MKEIKFRAWEKKQKKMIHFNSIHITYDESLVFDNFPESSYIDETFNKIDGEYELMQYTGLKDKNGKEIYEGDILETENRIVFVYWHFPSGSWDTTFIKYKTDKLGNGLENTEWGYSAEVIGNIYENPELLNNV